MGNSTKSSLETPSGGVAQHREGRFAAAEVALVETL